MGRPGPISVIKLDNDGLEVTETQHPQQQRLRKHRQASAGDGLLPTPADGAGASLSPGSDALLLGSPPFPPNGGSPWGALVSESSRDFSPPHSHPTTCCGRQCWLPACLVHEPLLAATLGGVLAGIALGAGLKYADLSEQAIELIGFPGELMLRLLKMLVLPLVAVSMVAGVCSLRESSKHSIARLARLTFVYYSLSTVVAIALGILLVVVIRPGRGSPFDHVAPAGGSCHAREQQAVAKDTSSVGQQSAATALLNVARQVVPDNIVVAAVDMNILGIITFSLMLGVALGSMGPEADGLVLAIRVMNAVVGRMVMTALWVSPLGVGSLIAASILRACDIWATLGALGLWVATVVVGLAVFAAAVLPLMLWATTRRSPLAATRGFGQALLMAFGTSSSAAALPLAMEAARAQGCEEATVNFFLPLGITVNLSGTALYEATTAIFIAQAHGVHLDAAQLLVVAFTASLAAVGAPAIPSAGLITQLIVLQAVGLAQFAADLAVVLAVDWLLDRIRTAVNLLGDGFGCLVVDSLMQRAEAGGRRGAVEGAGTPVSRVAGYAQVEMAEHP